MMGNPDSGAQQVNNELPHREIIGHSAKIAVVDVRGGFLGKEVAEMLDQMGYKDVSFVLLDEPVRVPEVIISELEATQVVLAPDQESYSRVKSIYGMESGPTLLSLSLINEDRHEVTPAQYGGSGQTDVSRFLNKLEEALVRMGFEYPDTQDAKSE